MKIRFRFEKLDVWHEARAVNREISRLARSFPAEERYALTSQLRRASMSVPTNISEGSGRNSDRDFAHFLEQAYGSLMEVANHLYLALDEGYLTEEQLDLFLEKLSQLGARVVALNRSLNVETTKINLPREAR